MSLWWDEFNDFVAEQLAAPADEEGPRGMTPLSADSLELLRQVESVFAITGRNTPAWGDPHDDDDYDPGSDGGPNEDEYSRVTDYGKYDIVHARAQAWIEVLLDRGACLVDRVPGEAEPDSLVAIADSVVVLSDGTERNPELVFGFAEKKIGHSVGSVTVSIGDPAIVLTHQPFCGCDACDSGSEELLEDLDEMIFSVVDGSLQAVVDGRTKSFRHSFGSQSAYPLGGAVPHVEHSAVPWFEGWKARPLHDGEDDF
ncbi:MAG: DUF6226 family protein [Brevibacterium sp.]